MSWRFAPDRRGTLPSHEIRRHCGLPIALCIQLRRRVALADCLWLQGNRTVIGRFDHNGLAFPHTIFSQKCRRKGQPRGVPQPLEYKLHFHISAMSCNTVPAYTKPNPPSNIVLRHRKIGATATLVSRHRSSVGLRWPSKRIAALHCLPIHSVFAARCALRCAPMAARGLRHLIGDATLAEKIDRLCAGSWACKAGCGRRGWPRHRRKILMQRRSIIKHAGIAGVLAAGAAPAVHAQTAIRWRLASSFPKSLDTVYGGAEVFSKAVKAMSGGKFEISVHAGGELMPPFGVVDGVQQGTVELAHTAPYYFYGKNPAFALGSAVPFGFNARQMNAWMMHGNGRKLMNEFYGAYSMISLPCGNTGAQMGGWYRKEIKSPADFKGMKIRLGGGLIGEVMQKLGAVPQSIPGGEIYQALEKGTLDAVEWVGPYDDQKLGFHKVAPYYYYPGWWEGGPEVALYINQKAFDSLSADNKAIVEAAAGMAHGDMLAKYDALNP